MPALRIVLIGIDQVSQILLHEGLSGGWVDLIEGFGNFSNIFGTGIESMKPAAYVSATNAHCNCEAILANSVGFENCFQCLTGASHAPNRVRG